MTNFTVMKTKEFDKFFRDKIDSMDGVPKSAAWNKAATWERLNEAMTRRPSGKWYKIAAASVALFFVKSQKIFAAASFATKAVVVVSTVAVVSTTSVVVYNASTRNDNTSQNIVASDNRTNTTVAENKIEATEESVVETPVEDNTFSVVTENNSKRETVKTPEQGNKSTVTQPEDKNTVVETPVTITQDAPADPVVETPRSQKREMSLEINDILFKKNSVEVNPKSMTELNYILSLMRENPDLKAMIMGYYDEKEKDGMHLQSQRATVVWKYLVSQGIEKTRLNFGGYGASKKYSSKLEEGRELNRRVEVMLSE